MSEGLRNRHAIGLLPSREDKDVRLVIAVRQRCAVQATDKCHTGRQLPSLAVVRTASAQWADRGQAAGAGQLALEV